MEQVRADAADLAQVRESVRLRGGAAMRSHQRERKDRRIVLRRATRIADFNDAIHNTNAILLDAANDCIMVLLHEIAFADVVSPAFGAKNQKTIESRPVIDFPRIAAARIPNLVRSQNWLRLRRSASVKQLCVVNAHVDSFDLRAAKSRHGC